MHREGVEDRQGNRVVRLDIERLDGLPSLGQQFCHVVACHDDILDDRITGHSGVPNQQSGADALRQEQRG